MSTPLFLEAAPEIDTNPTSFYRGGGRRVGPVKVRTWLAVRLALAMSVHPHIFWPGDALSTYIFGRNVSVAYALSVALTTARSVLGVNNVSTEHHLIFFAQTGTLRDSGCWLSITSPIKKQRVSYKIHDNHTPKQWIQPFNSLSRYSAPEILIQ